MIYFLHSGAGLAETGFHELKLKYKQVVLFHNFKAEN